MSRICHNCTNPVPLDAAFCVQCGAPRRHSEEAAIGITTRLNSPHPANHVSSQQWDSLVVAIGLLFAFLFVVGFAAALRTLGLSLQSVAAMMVPFSGALIAEEAWMQHRLRFGALGMLFWLTTVWGIGMFSAV